MKGNPRKLITEFNPYKCEGLHPSDEQGLNKQNHLHKTWLMACHWQKY